MIRWICLLLLIPILAVGEAAPISVMASVFEEETLSEPLSDLLNAKLSESNLLQVLERKDLGEIFTEKEFTLQSSAPNNTQSITGVSLFANLILGSSHHNAYLELVRPSGVIVYATILNAKGIEGIAAAAKIIVTQSTRLRSPSTPATSRHKRLAFISRTSRLSRLTESFTSYAVDQLRHSGYDILSRHSAQTLAEEAYLKQQAVISDSTKTQFHGAHYLVTFDPVETTGSSDCQLTVIAIPSGATVTSKTFNCTRIEHAKLINWLETQLKSFEHRSVTREGDFFIPERIEIALRAIQNHVVGSPLLSLDDYNSVVAWQGHWSFIREWQQAAYAELGLSELGSAHSTSSTSNPTLSPGVAFYGILADPQQAHAVPRKLELLVLQRLNKQSLRYFPQQPLFVDGKSRAIARELDLIVGLTQAGPLPWQESPFRLFEEICFGRLNKEGDQAILDLYRISHFSPHKRFHVQIKLPTDSGQLAESVQTAVRSLFEPTSLMSNIRARTVNPSTLQSAIEVLERKIRNKQYATNSESEVLTILASSPQLIKYIPLYPPAGLDPTERQRKGLGLLLSIASRLRSDTLIGPWIQLYTKQVCQLNQNYAGCINFISNYIDNERNAPFLINQFNNAGADDAHRMSIIMELQQYFPEVLSASTLARLTDLLRRKKETPELEIRFPPFLAGLTSPRFVVALKESSPPLFVPTNATAVSNQAQCLQTNHSWRSETRALSESNRMTRYLNILHNCTSFYRNAAKTTKHMEELSELALFFFQTKRFDLAAPLYQEIVSWTDENRDSPDPELQANGRYLLAQIARENNDLPLAFHQAQRCFELSKGQSYRLLDTMRGWTEVQLLEKLAGELITQLRISTLDSKLRDAE